LSPSTTDLLWRPSASYREARNSTRSAAQRREHS
jgi:hypothetical protein